MCVTFFSFFSFFGGGLYLCAKKGIFTTLKLVHHDATLSKNQKTKMPVHVADWQAVLLVFSVNCDLIFVFNCTPTVTGAFITGRADKLASRGESEEKVPVKLRWLRRKRLRGYGTWMVGRAAVSAKCLSELAASSKHSED